MTPSDIRPALIETMRAIDGEVPLLDWHMARLQASATALDYARPNAALFAAIRARAQSHRDNGAHRLRLVWSADGTPIITDAPLTPLAHGQQVKLATARVDSSEALLRHKTTHRPWYRADSEWLAAHPEVFDLLYFNERDELCEGTRTNVYIEIDGQWITPATACGCLPGVQRGALMYAGSVKEGRIDAALLQQATRIRLSNALRGWFDVRLA